MSVIEPAVLGLRPPGGLLNSGYSDAVRLETGCSHRLPRVHHFTVRIRCQDFDVNRLVGDLGAAGIMVGKFAGEPPEAEHVRAQLDAENAQEAKAHVIEALPPEGDYAVDEPVQID
jgi:hypothetical protein